MPWLHEPLSGEGGPVQKCEARLDSSLPAWFHNLLANPDVVFGGIPTRAAVVGDEAERRGFWALADRVFPSFAAYRREAAKADRTIPIVQLTTREPNTIA